MPASILQVEESYPSLLLLQVLAVMSALMSRLFPTHSSYRCAERNRRTPKCLVFELSPEMSVASQPLRRSRMRTRWHLSMACQSSSDSFSETNSQSAVTTFGQLVPQHHWIPLLLREML